MHIPKRYLLYQQKYVAPYVNMLLQVVSFFAHLAAVALIVCATLEFGFELSAQLRYEFAWLYFCVWITFLVDRISHLILKKSAYSFWGWGVNALLALTLLPIIVKVLGIDDSTGVMSVLDNRVFHLLVLFVISVIDLSDAMMSSLGKKSNPALMMAVSFLFIILVGSGLLLMPRCVHHGHRRTYYIYRVWTDGHHAIDTDRWFGCDDHYQFLRPFLYGQRFDLQPDARARYGEFEVVGFPLVDVA